MALSMKVVVLGMAVALAAGCSGKQPTDANNRLLAVTDLRTEYQANPLGIDVIKPRFSWQLRSDARGTIQAAYQIQVGTSASDLQQGLDLIWDSGKVGSAQSNQLIYAGPPLRSRDRRFWRVRVWDRGGAASQWSSPAEWEMGLLSASEWSAQWVQAPAVLGNDVLVRRGFTLKANVKQARIYATSHGLYQLLLNGKRVGNAELTPGWTSYRKRLQYQTYDVTPLLTKGENALGAMLGEGWYIGELAFQGNRHLYGDRTALLLQLEVTYTDGTSERIVTDRRWKAGASPILMSGLYAGETYDARLEQPGWKSTGFDDGKWRNVKVTAASKEVLIAQSGPLTRAIEQVVPKAILRGSSGETIIDMGQNMVGRVRLSVEGPAGTTITLRHAEMLDARGNLYTDNLRAAQATVRYVLKGGSIETFEPRFTFQGFRYVGVKGYPGELAPQKITGIVLHSDIGRSGHFETSSPLLDQLQHNIVWGQKGNFLDIPTDCPQRDERLGWTGDAQVFASTAAFNADVAGFFSKWLRDLAAEQYGDGSVPFVIPDVIYEMNTRDIVEASAAIRRLGKIRAAGAAGWADAAVIIPWTLYLAYGDRQILETQYASMARWVGYEQERAGEDLLWTGDLHFGDWLDFGSADRGNFGATSSDLIATAYFAHSVDLMSRAAKVLGKNDEAARYAKLFSDIRAAFQRAFVTADAKVGEGTQTAYVLALQFDLLPTRQRALAAKHLVADVRRNGHLTTGFLGTPGLLFALSESGYLDDAYRLLQREDYPSWLYPVKHGATTIWERWDGVKLDGSFQTPGMNSFNHYAYGAVGDWMYRVIGGINIDPDRPGYKHILIKPRPGGGLTRAKASHQSPYGEVSSAWKMESGRFHLAVRIPPNTTATVTLPSARGAQNVLESGRPIAASDTRQVGSGVEIDIGSGAYEFSYALN